MVAKVLIRQIRRLARAVEVTKKRLDAGRR
jgi:hypothetical protein